MDEDRDIGFLQGFPAGVSCRNPWARVLSGERFGFRVRFTEDGIAVGQHDQISDARTHEGVAFHARMRATRSISLVVLEWTHGTPL